MSNPLLSSLLGNNISDVASLYSAFRNGKNPMAIMQSLAGSNPQIKSIMSQLQNGANPKQLFYSLCQSNGINPSSILDRMNG